MDLLLVADAYLGRTPLAWLGVGPTSSSPAAVKAELEKLDTDGYRPLRMAETGGAGI